MIDITVKVPESIAAFYLKPIRTKKDIVLLLIETIRLALAYTEDLEDPSSSYSIRFKVNKMNRVIYSSPSKVFSIRNPFNVRYENGSFSFVRKSGESVNSYIISNLALLMKNDKFESGVALEFIEMIQDFNLDVDEYWVLISELFGFEEGYLRFDHDSRSENGRHHPLYHFDIFYTNASTFKVGAHVPPCGDFLLDLLDVSTESKYLER